MPIGPSRLNDDVFMVLNSRYHPDYKLQLLPCFSKVDGVNIIVATLEDVTFHLEVTVLGSEVNFDEHHQYVLFLL